MLKLPGEIFIAPRIIYWVAMPKTVGKDIVLEMLKKDVLIIPIEYDEVEGKKYREAVYLYNLDKLQTLMGAGARPGEYEKQLIKKIREHSPKFSMVHTGQLNPALKKLFAASGINYIEKNFRDLDIACDTLGKIMKAVFQKVYDKSRAYLRIEMHPAMNLKVVIKNKDEENRNFYLKDLSLNGFKLGCPDASELKFLNVKDLVELQVYLPSSIVRIAHVLVSRIEPALKQVAVSFNINQPLCISNAHANVLVQMVHDWLVNVVKEKENETEIDFTRITGSV